jgi:hypothetical protein
MRAATAALAVYWALVTLGGQFSLDPPAPLYDLWYSAAPIFAGAVAAFVAGFCVGRWALLLVAAVPPLVLGALQLAGHVAPWHDAGPALSYWWERGGWWVTFWSLAFPLGLGVLLRRKGLAPDRERHRRSLAR